MWDPPTEVHTIALDNLEGRTNFRIEFVTPASRSSIYLYQPAIGSESAILFHLSSLYGIPMIISIALLFIGFGLSLLSLAFHSFAQRGRRLLYPGLLSLASGTWQFAENALTVYLTQMPAVMYILAFAGMMLLTLPLIRLTIVATGRDDSILLRFLLHGLQIMVTTAFALQLAGIVQFSQSSRLFSIALPAIIITLTAFTFRAYHETHDRVVLRYAVSVLFLSVGSILELLNYFVRVLPLVSGTFQVFMLAFIVASALSAVRFTQRVYFESLQKLELDRDVQMLEQSIDAQKQRNKMLLQHEQELRRMRHDLRHHFVFLNSLVKEGRYDDLAEYLTGFETSVVALERPPRTFCDNTITNALVSHYADIADDKGYRFKALLNVPADMPHLTDGDLCVALGNLLENASESCARIKKTDPDAVPEIDLKARKQGPLLFITLDNSIGSAPKKTEGGRYATSKREGSHGIGLHSIQVIAQKYDGEASFTVSDGMFHSSLYLEM